MNLERAFENADSTNAEAATSHRKEPLHTVLTVAVVLMSIIQIPLFYYYSSGVTGLFLAAPYLLAGAGLTAFLFVRENAFSAAGRSKTRRAILICTALIGVGGMALGDWLMAEVDWRLRRQSREEIVSLVKERKITPNVSDRPGICILDNEKYPLISNGGNEIVIERNSAGKVSVEFYIDRGFLDHYSAFIYSEAPERIAELDQLVGWNSRRYHKISSNWYKMSF